MKSSESTILLPEDSNTMQSLDRAMRVLRAVATCGAQGARLAEVADKAGLSRSTTHRFLGALAQAGLLDQNENSASYFLGLELCSLGARAANRFELKELAQPMMERLSERTADTVFLSLRSGYEAICIERVEGQFPIKTLTLDVGDRRPLGVGAGSLALLSFQPDAFVEKAVAANDAAIRMFPTLDRSRIFELVAETRRQGYSFNDERIIAGMSGLAVPVLGKNGNAVAALSVAAISTRMTAERRATLVEWLRAEAKALQDELTKITAVVSEQSVRRLARRRGSPAQRQITG